MFLAVGRFEDARGPFGRTGELTGTGAEIQLAFVDAVTAYAASGEPQALPGLETYPDPSAWLATQLFLVGQRDEALDVLERGVEQRVWDMMTIGGNSVFRALDDEPRYEALLSAVGIE